MLEVAVGRNKIKTWIARAVDRISGNITKDVLETLEADGIIDLADHLYASGRCAIAHASSNPIIDPDRPEDARRLFQELPLVEALAALAIEENLGVKASTTNYREHLYELAGFKEIFGKELVDKIVNHEELPQNTQVDIPKIDIRLYRHNQLDSLSNLEPLGFQVDAGQMRLAFVRSEIPLQVEFTLNFDDERLEFDIQNGIFGSEDDGSPSYACSRADIQEFAKLYYLNGCLEIYDSETGVQIARKDAFIPVNVVVQPEGFDREIESWRNEADRRQRESDQRLT